jgi:hypothetical protein
MNFLLFIGLWCSAKVTPPQTYYFPQDYTVYKLEAPHETCWQDCDKAWRPAGK